MNYKSIIISFFKKKSQSFAGLLFFSYFCHVKRMKRTMKATDQTIQQLERALRKVMEKFPITEEASILTDIHIRVTQETGEVMVFDDDEQELMSLFEKGVRLLENDYLGGSGSRGYGQIKFGEMKKTELSEANNWTA